MKKTVQFVPQSLNYDPKKIKEELDNIMLQMIETHDNIIRILNSLIEEGSYNQDLIIKTKQQRDTAIISLMNELQNKETENARDYYRQLEISAKDGNINTSLFMECLLTCIKNIGIRINNLEKELQERTN